MNIDLLKRLCETPGIAGHEERVRAIVAAELRDLVDEVRVDVMGNLMGIRKGAGGPRVVLAAHMDEIGFLVKYIDDHGFLRLHPIGGFDARVLLAQRVLVQGKDGQTYRGALQVATKPFHLLDPNEAKPPKIEELFVDLGLPVERVREAVEIGAMVTLDRTLEEIGDCVLSKSLDDRVSLFIMLEALRAMRGGNAELIAVATTQEEVGLRGAQTAGYALEPAIAIALDTTLAVDYPGAAVDQAVTRLGAGPAIKLMDSASISHPQLVRHFRDVAERENIPYQLEILPRGGTDAGALQRSRAGAVAITLSTPSRYVHTVNELCNRDDIARAIQLLAAYLPEAGTRDYGAASA